MLRLDLAGFAAAAFWLLLAFCFAAAADHDRGRTSSRVAEGLLGAVASDEGRCSNLGRDVMAGQGGNAVDASVAVALCLGVLNPMASGIGGGGFLLLLPAGVPPALAFDFREVAPAAASQNMYSENSDLQVNGALSVAVPSELAGLHLVWQQHGSLPWKTLVEPAIHLAENGFEVRPYLAHAINSSSTAILADEGLREVFAPNGNLLRAGDICIRTALATTLRSIALDGPGTFYKGSIAENFVKDVKDAGGIITMEDLAAYRVKVRKPIVQEIQGLTIYGMPPPSSGGACIAMVLNILAAYPEPFEAVRGSLGLHRMVEAFKHVFAVRMNLGDPDFVNVTDVLTDMLNATFAAELQKLIYDNGTFSPTYYGGRWSQLEDHGTSHFNIVDQDRNVVSMTTTINYSFGAKILSKSTGIVLNNEMGDFSLPTSDPGTSPAAQANFIQPYKRPLSSMSPTIVMKDGKFLGALGGSGGVKIITTTIQVYLNRFWKGYQPLPTVANPRIHHQLMPDVLDYEDWTTVEGKHIEEPEVVVEYLESKGHNLTGTTGAMSQLIVQDLSEPLFAMATHRDRRKMLVGGSWMGKLTAVSDLRKDGYPVAF